MNIRCAALLLILAAPCMVCVADTPVWEPTDWEADQPSAPLGNSFPNTTPHSDDFSVSLTTDLLIYGRSGAESAPQAFDGMGNVAFNLGDLDFDAQVGPRVSVLLGGRRSGMEWCFFTFNSHTIAETVDVAGVTPVFFGGVPANLASSYDFRADARLVSNEFNFWHNAGTAFRYGLGLRRIDFDESFDVLNGDNSGAGFFSTTENKLAGGQIMGGLTVFSKQSCIVEVVGKSGIYYNDLELDGITAFDELHVDDDTTSYVIEINLVAEWWIGRHTSLRAGYGVLWLDDVASAADQNNDFNIFSGVGEFDLSRPIYQGGFIGLQARW